MNDRYMVISPDTLEAMRRAGHAAKLEARIEKLEAALREIIVHCEVPAPPNAEALKMFARKALEGKDE
jgi:tRNA A37 methylthiotransferase MiaB